MHLREIGGLLRAGSAMNRRAEFCRKQAQRLFSLAEQCVDPQIRDQVSSIAREWEQQANAKEGNTLGKDGLARGAEIDSDLIERKRLAHLS
jgi:hypothetical protein